MGCKVPMTVTVRLDRYTQCQHLMEAGEFENISELLRFAMRVYYDRLRRERPTSVELVRRGEGKSIQVRLDEAVVDGIVAMGLMARSDICDYALDYYLNEYRRGIQRSESFGFASTRNPDPSGMIMSSSRSTSTPTRLKNTAFLRSASVVRAM